MKNKFCLIIISILIILPSQCYAKEDKQNITTEQNESGWSAGDIDWSKTNPIDLINILKECKQKWVTVGQAPKGWIKNEHVECLMKLIDSKEPAVPVVAIISSYLPQPGKSSTIGNEAMFLIEGFKEDVYPPGICSVYGFKGNPEEYRKWWVAIKNEIGDEKAKHSYKPPLGYVSDKEIAIKIAEAVLTPIYGKEVIEKEKPFNAELAEGIWIITGTLNCPGGGHNCSGGVAVIEISKDDGKILRVSHGQ